MNTIEEISRDDVIRAGEVLTWIYENMSIDYDLNNSEWTVDRCMSHLKATGKIVDVQFILLAELMRLRNEQSPR